jgi:hypothetical protein
MKTEKELEEFILNITMKIQTEYPELSKFIKEMPENVSENNKDAVNSTNMEEYYNSLVKLLAEYAKTHEAVTETKAPKKKKHPGYPYYLPSEDIYNQDKKETELNPENPSKKKTQNETSTSNEKTFKEDMSGADLDVPGSELDDQQESVGSEDEENNYYSLGGDNHNNLEEDKG